MHTLLFGWHTQGQLGKDFNKQYKQQIPYTKISYNIPSNNYIMQDHAKQGYIFGHLSLIRSLAINIPSGVAKVRDLEKGASQKREIFRVVFRAPLFLGKWCGVATFFFF